MKILGTADHILDLVNQPAFTVHAGKILRLNQAARALLIKENTPIMELIPYNQDAYAQFTGGCLYLTLRIYNTDCGASITKSGRYHIFVLDEPQGGDQLNALALSGNLLKAPLSSMNALLDTHYIPEEQDSPKAKNAAAQLRKTAAQLHRIVTNMCDGAAWSRPQGEKELCNVTEEFSQIMEKSKDALSYANIRLTYSCPQIPVLSMVDAKRLQRSVYNLVSNAVKHASGKPYVEAEMTYDKEFIYIHIQNPCFEKDQEHFTTAFTHYLRRPSIDNGRSGIGLGMVLIRGTALSHQGVVHIHQPDPCTMRVTLSLKIQDPDDITILRSPTKKLSNYTGGKDIALIEFSEFLPDTCYTKDL